MNLSANNRALLWWLGGIVATMAMIYGLAKLGSGPTPESLATILQVNDADHVSGLSTAPVTIVEYSDFQCPACAYIHPILKAAQEKAGDKLRFVYRNFPLRDVHQNAQSAAQAAEAAAIQGKFWEMYDLLFNRQSSWSNSSDVRTVFTGYAKELGLDADKFATDMVGQTVIDRVRRDYDTGIKIKLNSTPTIYLNNKIVELPLYQPTDEESKLTNAQQVVIDKSAQVLVDMIDAAAK